MALRPYFTYSVQIDYNVYWTEVSVYTEKDYLLYLKRRRTGNVIVK
jgi:hypothetical protein